MPLPYNRYPIYALSDVTGLTEWVDYIPVQVETDGRAGSFDNEGYIVSDSVLTDNTGRVAWVDYIPVYEVTGRTKPWYVSSDGYIPYNEIGSVVAWTPAALFASGEVGAWYDPSDLDTMFQESTGVTPVTAVEQSVGLILDKSQGLTIGSELVTNGTFDTDTTGWASPDATLSVVSGALRVEQDAVGDFSRAYQAITCEVGSWYQVSGTLVGKTAATAALRINTTSTGTSIGQLNVNIADPTGTFFGYFLATATTHYVWCMVNTSADNVYADFDNISVKKIAGNHAYQATAASRPVLRARHNLLTYSEQFDNAAWTKSGVTITQNAIAAPDGTTTADHIVSNEVWGKHFVRSLSVSIPVGQTVTASFYAKAGTNSVAVAYRWVGVVDLDIAFDLSTQIVTVTNGTSGTIEDVGDGWYRCSATWTSSSATSSAVDLYIGSAANTNTPISLYYWGAQLDYGTTALPYQRIAAATDYVTSSTMETYDFPYYLDFDGVDDSLATAEIDFSATDKMSVFAGVNRESEDNGPWFYFGTPASGYTAVPGSALLTSEWSAAQDIYVGIGMPAGGFVYKSYTRPSPERLVLTASYDASQVTGALALDLRINGSLATADTATQSGASATTFGNLQIGMGRHQAAYVGDSIYSLIVRGSTSTAEEIAAAESYVAGKTGVTLA